jgi:hypothetical protein
VEEAPVKPAEEAPVRPAEEPPASRPPEEPAPTEAPAQRPVPDEVWELLERLGDRVNVDRALAAYQANPSETLAALRQAAEVGGVAAEEQLGPTGGERFDVPGREYRPAGGALSPAKGDIGVARSIEAAMARGETVIGQQVSVTVQLPNGATIDVIVDLVVRTPSGQIKFIDAKYGPGARLTENQVPGYPIVRTQGGIPHGPNAEAALGPTGWQPGQPIGPTEVQVDWWF